MRLTLRVVVPWLIRSGMEWSCPRGSAERSVRVKPHRTPGNMDSACNRAWRGHMWDIERPTSLPAGGAEAYQWPNVNWKLSADGSGLQ